VKHLFYMESLEQFS